MVEGTATLILEDLFAPAAPDKDLLDNNDRYKHFGGGASPSLNRSHSMDDLSLCIERERLHNNHENSSNNMSQSPLPRSTSCAPVDLRQVSSEMPICLLEEDEENDEEIKRLTEKETAMAMPTTSIGLTSDDVMSEEHSPLHPTSGTADVMSPYPQTLSKAKNKSRTNLKKQHQPHKREGNSLSNFDSLSVGKPPLVSVSPGLGGNEIVTASHDVLGLGRNCKNSRKTKLLKPHPPVTSYGAFIRENQVRFSGDSITSQDLARNLGQLWASLDQPMKQEYTVKSQVDQYRYLRELKEFLWIKFEGACDKMAISSLVEETIASTQQHNNAVLTCHLCKIFFCNLFRKQAHFCGRPHCNELLAKLLKLVPEQLLLEKEHHTNSDNHHDSSGSDCSEEEEGGGESFRSLEHLVSSYCDHQTHSSVAISPLKEEDSSSFDEEPEDKQNEDALISESVAIAVESVLCDAHELVNEIEASTHSFTSEMITSQELINCYCHLLEREYEIKHWSLAYKEAVDTCLIQIQTNRQSLQRLLQLIEKVQYRSKD